MASAAALRTLYSCEHWSISTSTCPAGRNTRVAAAEHFVFCHLGSDPHGKRRAQRSFGSSDQGLCVFLSEAAKHSVWISCLMPAAHWMRHALFQWQNMCSATQCQIRPGATQVPICLTQVFPFRGFFHLVFELQSICEVLDQTPDDEKFAPLEVWILLVDPVRAFSVKETGMQENMKSSHHLPKFGRKTSLCFENGCVCSGRIEEFELLQEVWGHFTGP